ncbi:ATP-binding protein [Streptomyces sp. NPDC050704]|uniref:sensor histidine kinase n=1 Tax=Streptomyces sp. NPDC050704 TaxID=3157219 RepID=UPI00344918FB
MPPVLAELGLVPALRELVMRYEADGLQVLVRADSEAPTDAQAAAREVSPVPPVAPDVAGTVYAVVAEALRNVSRHSGARTCTVTLVGLAPGAGPRLTVSVEDDGRGVGPAARPGVGTQSLRERAEALGGTVTWRPGEGGRGTRIDLDVPLVPPASLESRASLEFFDPLGQEDEVRGRVRWDRRVRRDRRVR